MAADLAIPGTEEILEREAQEQFDRLNGLLTSLGLGYKLALVDPRDLEEIDKNAHFMKHETFKQLTANVKRDGTLSSVPFCWKPPEPAKMVILSGNHRVKSAIAAEIRRIVVMYDDRPLSLSERRAIQLSHNAIIGQDDAAILKELWDEIDDLGMKVYSGLDDKALKQLADASLAAMNEATLSFKSVTFLFLPEEAEALEAAFKRAADEVVCDEAYLLPMREFAALIDGLDKTKAAWNTKNNPVALFLMLRVFEAHWDDLISGWLTQDGEGQPAAKHTDQVPLESLLGTNKVPAKVMVQVKKAWDKASGAGKVNKREPWKLIEEMAAAYLGGKKE